MKFKRFLGLVLCLSMTISNINIFRGETEIFDKSQYTAVEPNENVDLLATYTTTYDVDGGKLYFNENTGAVTDCDLSVTKAVIPSQINGVTVTAVGDNSFYNCANLTSVIIPNSVTSIGNSAFMGCTSLKSVNIPSSITSIGKCAFYGCTSLLSITIPSSVASVGENAFYNCALKTAGPIGGGYDYEFGWEDTIPNTAFYGCTSLTSVNIPSGITIIGNFAFYYCTSLTSVNIPNSVTTVGDGAFSECASLTSVTIPNSVTVIGVEAFYGCTSLGGITIPSSVTSIGLYAFSGCTFKTAGPIGGGYDYEFGWKDAIPNNAFSRLPNLISADIPSGITIIGKFAFCECTSLTSITIPSGVTSIDEYTFYGCTSLTSAALPSGLTSIGDSAFYECKSLTDIVLPSGLTNIGKYAFSGSGLTSVTIPDGITQIAEGVFKSCQNLTNVTFPSDLRMIGEYAFYNCGSLTNLKLPNSLKYIYGYSFYGCVGLTYLTIPNSGIIRIYDYAFYGCTGIEKAVIPSSIKEICSYAFYNCTSLTDVYYRGKKSEWESITVRAENTPLENAEIHYSYGFSVEEDGWSFSNSSRGFGYDDDYYIPEERYAHVFGGAYLAIAKANDKNYSSMINDSWGGNCNGMSAAAVLFNLAELDWDYYDDLYENDFSTVNSYFWQILAGKYIDSIFGMIYQDDVYVSAGKDTEITKLIECYQILQNSSNGYLTDEETSTYFKLTDSYMTYTKTDENTVECNHLADGAYISDILDKISESDIPLGIGLQYKSGGHMIVSRTDKAPDYEGDGWWKVYVYDPNIPYTENEEGYSLASNYYNYLSENDDDTYIELNPDENKWRYYGSSRSDIAGSCKGCDLNGNVLTMESSCTDDNGVKYSCKIPEYIVLVDFTYMPTVFDCSEPFENEDYFILNATNTSDFRLINASGDTAVAVKDGQAVVLDETVTNVPIAEGSSDGGMIKLMLPIGRYTVDYLSGDDITILGCGKAVSIMSDGDCTVDVDLLNGSFEVSAEGDNNILLQASNIFDNADYSSVVFDGLLNDGNVLTAQLSGDNTFTADLTTDGDNIVSVYTDGGDGEAFLLELSKDSKEVFDNITSGNSPSVTKGDVNFDGRIDSADAVRALLAYTEKVELTSEEFSAADVNSDGRVDSSDAVAILLYYSGFITEF